MHGRHHYMSERAKGGDMRAGPSHLGVIAATAQVPLSPCSWGDEVRVATVRPFGYRLLHVVLTGPTGGSGPLGIVCFTTRV